ncbi:MAG: hypothetical protein AAGF31_07535 [Planctomycetota bacterium]
MTATIQRDKVAALAKQNPQKALAEARRIADPWFQAQAYSWVARFTDGDPIAVAKQAAKASAKCADEFKRAAVRSWEIAALAERGELRAARSALDSALTRAAKITPKSSQAEALTLLLHAAIRIDEKAARKVAQELQTHCGADSHWRCKRALKNGNRLLERATQPRPFFW